MMGLKQQMRVNECSVRTLLNLGIQPSIGANFPEGNLSFDSYNQLLNMAYLKLTNFTS